MGEEQRKNNLIPVGKYVEQFNILTEQNLPCGTIYQSSGLEKHIKKRHPEEIRNLEYVREIISDPDYVGKNPKEPASIELVKVLSDNVMVCIKLDITDSYFYVASVFNIRESKLNNRINSGRLKKYRDK